MALAYATVKRMPDKYTNVIDITLDGSYASGGYVIDPKSCGMLSIDNLAGGFVTGEGFGVSWVASTGKMKLWKSSAGATAFTEGVAGDFTSAMKVRAEVTGTPLL